MVRKILSVKEATLRRKSKPVKKIDKKIKTLISDLKDTLKVQSDPEGIGLAAPQIGKNVRIFLMKPDAKIKTIINPKIVKIYKKSKKGKGKAAKKIAHNHKIMEGCLSLPYFYGPLKRAEKIKLKYLNEKGEEKTETFEGLKAQIVQHEIDHLEGVLFVDRLLEQKGKLFEFHGDEWEEVELI